MTTLELAGKYDKKKAYRERHKDKVSENKRRYRQTEGYKKIQHAARTKYGERIKNELTDKYIVGLLCQFSNRSEEYRQLIYSNNILIEAKRQQIRLKRLANHKINK